MVKLRDILWKGVVLLSVCLGSVSLLAAQSFGRQKKGEYTPRVNVGQDLTLSQEFSRYGGSSYGFTNVYSNWNVSVALPRSDLSANFSVGGHFTDTGAVPGESRVSLYKSLFNTFDIGFDHQFNPKWELSVSNSLMAYPTLDWFSGRRDFEAALGPQAGFSGSQVARTAGTFGGRFSGYPGAYPGYYGFGYGTGTFVNAFDATLAYTIDSRRQLSFTFDSFVQSFSGLGFNTNTFTTAYTHAITPKLSLEASYVVGRYGFEDDEDPGLLPMTAAAEAQMLGASGRGGGGFGFPETPPQPVRPSSRTRSGRFRFPQGSPNPVRPLQFLQPNKPKGLGLTHTVLVGFAYSFSPDFTVEFSMGPSLSPGEKGYDLGMAATTSVAFTKAFRNKSALSVEYSRFMGGSLSQLFTGQSGSEMYLVTYGFPISSRLSGDVSITKFIDPFYGSGTFVSGDFSYRYTKSLTGTYNVTFYPGQRSQGLGLLGSGLTNSFTISYPLKRDLTTFISYFFTVYGSGDDVGPDGTRTTSRGSRFGNSISIGLNHSIPSIFRMGRVR